MTGFLGSGLVSSYELKNALSVLPAIGWHVAELREVSESDRGTVRLRFSIAGNDDDADVGKSVTLSVTPACDTQSAGSRQHLIRAAHALQLVGDDGGKLPTVVEEFDAAVGVRCRLYVVHEKDEGGQVYAKVGHGGVGRLD